MNEAAVSPGGHGSAGLVETLPVVGSKNSGMELRGRGGVSFRDLGGTSPPSASCQTLCEEVPQ